MTRKLEMYIWKRFVVKRAAFFGTLGMILADGCKSLMSPNSGNHTANSKGVHREVESEGNWRLTFGLTNRNFICSFGIVFLGLDEQMAEIQIILLTAAHFSCCQKGFDQQIIHFISCV